MLTRLRKIFVVFALVFTTGAHWAALQTVAWTTMLADNLCNDSFSEAVSKTFDGEHPCCLCKAIAAAKKSEKKSAAIAPVLKMEFPPLAEKIVLIAPSPLPVLPAQNFCARQLFQKPPTPPPRFV